MIRWINNSCEALHELITAQVNYYNRQKINFHNNNN